MRSLASGWWLTALRIGCALLAALCLALYLIELPERYAELAASAPATAGMLRLYAGSTFALELLVSLWLLRSPRNNSGVITSTTATVICLR